LKGFLPKTLKSQALLILSGTFVISHLVTLLIYETNRDSAIILTEATDLAARIAGIVDLADEFQGQQRRRILEAAQTQFLAMYPEITFPEDAKCQDNEFAARMLEEFQILFAAKIGIQTEVCVRDLIEPSLFQSLTATPGFDVLVYINFHDGEESIFHVTLPRNPSLFVDIALVYMLLTGIAALLIARHMIFRIISPLDKLAKAADDVGVNIDAPVLREEGSIEVQTAARAFNRMQSRLQRLIHGQTEMIAAISHDLRSAVTRLHLRAELLKDPQERDGFVRVVRDMNLMVQSVIDFLRGIDTTEQPRRMNIAALVESLCEDLAEEGYPVSFTTTDKSVSLQCRPAALRRGLLNVINNSVKYADSAQVSFFTVLEHMIIRVEDNGPGVPEHEIENLFRPFYRLEQSRSLDTGGVGLGLAITQSVIQAHGGTITIMNRPQGGLRVDIKLFSSPSQADSHQRAG